MCIRDRAFGAHIDLALAEAPDDPAVRVKGLARRVELHAICLLYTSDAADDLRCVDIGGRRSSKKKKAKDIRIYWAQYTHSRREKTAMNDRRYTHRQR